MPRRRRLDLQRRGWLLLAGVLAIVIVGTSAVVETVRHRPAGYAGPWANQSDPGPILLVPGYGGSKGALNALAARLTAVGRTAIVVTLPGDGTGDLATDAAVLNNDVAATIHGDVHSVDLVGYSAGGVVIRLWLNKFQPYDEVRRVVTLGSPLHGTSVAGLASVFLAGPDCPAACRQLAPFSDLIHDLNDEPVPQRLPWVSIWSENDTVVTPPDSARLAGAVNIDAQHVCSREHISHSHLPTDPLVAGVVIGALNGPVWTRPPASSACAQLRTLGVPAAP